MKNRIPPHDIELEKQVIGNALFDNVSADLVAQAGPEIFYDDKHRIIVKAIRLLRNQNIPADMMTVKDYLKKSSDLDRIGGISYLVTIDHSVANHYQTEHHLIILREQAAGREMLKFYHKAIDKLYLTGDVKEVLDENEIVNYEILTASQIRKSRGMNDIATETLETLDRRMASKGGIVGVPTGMPDFDRISFGLMETELMIVGGRPGMGKTDFGLNIALNASKMGYKAGFITLEVSDTQIMERLISIQSGLGKSKIIRGELEPKDLKQVHQAISVIQKSGLCISDMAGVGISEVKKEIRDLVLKGCKVVILDYLGLVNLEIKTWGSVNNALGDISRKLKQYAKEFNIPIVALQQLNRNVENRGGDKRPILADLRDSGNLEQDADRVVFLYRPEYYGFETDDEGNSTVGMIEYNFAKNRHGVTGPVKGQYSGATGIHQGWNAGAMNTDTMIPDSRIILPPAGAGDDNPNF